VVHPEEVKADLLVEVRQLVADYLFYLAWPELMAQRSFTILEKNPWKNNAFFSYQKSLIKKM
jgi:hypothetical protein